MDKKIKDKIEKIVNAFETGSAQGSYGDVSIFNDGPGDIAQITFGRSQTTEFGHLKELLQRYVDAKGLYADFFAGYLSKIGKTPSLSKNKIFVETLEKSGTDPIMVQVQDKFFDDVYWTPAEEWFKEHGFTLPLSMLVIYDSFIHSGSILKILRNRFAEKVPAQGGNEKKWIDRYLETRSQWLKHHSKKILRNTVYRTRDMQRALDAEDWNLKNPFSANGVLIS